MDRDPRVYLAADEWRCLSDKCTKRVRCTRRVAELKQGSPLRDGLLSDPATGNPWNAIFGIPQVDCTGYLKLGTVKPPDPPQKAAHPPLRGLSVVYLNPPEWRGRRETTARLPCAPLLSLVF